MKKSRIAKLALMGASITALAATLTTSTYAWYVSNKVANVKSGAGTTGTAGADGSVLLSWTNTGDSIWTKDLTFNDVSNGAADLREVKLTPCHYDTDGFYDISDTGEKGAKLNANAKSAKGSYLYFTIYAKTESADPVTIKPSIVINNTTTYAAATHDQLAYVGTTKGSPVPEGTFFHYDVLDALYVQQTCTAATTTETYVAASATGIRGTSTNYTGATAAGSGDAHKYYNNVSGTTLTFGTAPVATTALSNISITTTPVAINYAIFLEGGDEDCFNSCASQTFSFEISLQVQ